MKFKIILLTLIGGSLVASGLPQSPKSPESPKYKMPNYAAVFKVLNNGNDVPHSTFYYEKTNVEIAFALAKQEFTRKELVNRLHHLTQQGVEKPRVNPLCSRKATLLIEVASKLPNFE